jgi:hypothetical protein
MSDNSVVESSAISNEPTPGGKSERFKNFLKEFKSRFDNRRQRQVSTDTLSTNEAENDLQSGFAEPSLKPIAPETPRVVQPDLTELPKPDPADPQIEPTEVSNESGNPIEKLKPVEFIDADGATREVFTFINNQGNEVKVVFYTREELPYSSEVIEGTTPVILGEAPKHRDKVEWEEFIKDVKDASGNQDPLNQDGFQVREARKTNNTLLLVENTPLHILDLAFHLGLEGKQWREARQAIAQRNVYSPEVISMIDDMIAGTVVDDEGNLVKRGNQRGEALAVMALLGDTKARASLDKKRTVLEDLDKKRQDHQSEFYANKYQALTEQGAKIPERPFWATHVTSFKPEVTDQGILVRSSFDGSGGELIRNTVHFSLNGPINSAFGGGGWENMPYVISGNLSDMRDANGNPLMVNPVDTYFLTNPGQPLLIPNAELTMPGKLPPGVIREKRGNVTVYKDEGLAPEDIDTLFKTQFDENRGILSERVNRSFSEYVWSSLRGAMKRSNPDMPFNDQEPQRVFEVIQSADPEAIFTNLRTNGIKATVGNILEQTGLAMDNTEIESFEGKLETWLVEKIRNGNFFESADNRSSKMERLDLELLAASWGTNGSNRSQAHSEDPDGGIGLTNYTGKIFEKVAEQKLKLKEWEEEKENERGYKSLPPRLRIEENAGLREIKVDDRQSIMGAFRDSRIGVMQGNYGIARPENRRMFYVAGII